MYTASFGMLGTQYILGDVLQIDMVTLVDTEDPITGDVTPAGTPIKSQLMGFVNTGTFNDVAGRVTTGDYTNSDASFFDKVISFSVAAAHIAWDVMSLLSGTYIFNLAFMFGIPFVFVFGFVVIYIFFLIRTAIATIRGV